MCTEKRSCALRTCILYPGIQIQSGKEVQGEIIHCGNLAGKKVALYMPIDAQYTTQGVLIYLVRLTVECGAYRRPQLSAPEVLNGDDHIVAEILMHVYIAGH